MTHTIDEKIMKPYLQKLIQEHRRLNKLIDTSKGFARAERTKQLKRLRLRLKDRISLIQRHYYGRSAAI